MRTAERAQDLTVRDLRRTGSVPDRRSAPPRRRVGGSRAGDLRLATGRVEGARRRLLESDAGEPAAARRRDSRYRRLLALADGLAAAVALSLCVLVLGQDDRLLPAAVLSIPLLLLASKVLGLYDRDELLLSKTTLDEGPQLFQLTTLAALLLWMGQGIVVSGDLGRDQVFGFGAVFFILLFAGRATARQIARAVTEPELCVLMGDGAETTRVRQKLEQDEHTQVVAQVNFESDGDAEFAAEALQMVAAEREVHRVVVSPPSSDHGGILDLIRVAKALGLKVSVLPKMFEVVGSAVEFDDVAGLNVLAMRRFGLTRSSRLLKRGLDLTVASIVFAFVAPLMAVIAAAVRLDSPGPILFRQKRVGRDGLAFEIFKFRTMDADAERRKQELGHLNEADGLFKIADDPRITRVGAFLRSTSLDELPQLLNVLRGEMSLVGPRPLVEEDDSRVRGHHRQRLHLTPGMTGRWQILGSARVPLHEMVVLDYLYVANWSLWGDVKILLRTVPFVLARKGL